MDNIVNRACRLSIRLKTTLINCYGNNKQLVRAMDIYNSIPEHTKDIVCIGAMMKAYIDNEHNLDAIQLYDTIDDMTRLNKDEICHCLAIKACANVGDSMKDKGTQIAAKIVQDGYDSIQIKNTLMDFYGHCGEIEKAKKVFDSIDDIQKDTVSVNSMMNVYFMNNMNEECVGLFQRFNDTDFRLKWDNISFTTVLIACTNLSWFDVGRDIHNEWKILYTDNNGYIDALSIQISLINMYGKLGEINICQQIFDEIKQREYETKYLIEISLWNAMIQSYGNHGYLQKAMDLFDKMRMRIGPIPNQKTYVLLLGACNHSFNVDKARNIWLNEIDDINIKYDKYVMSAIIDTFARCGYLNETYEWILKYEKYMENKHYDEIMWTSLLSGCRIYNKYLFAEYVYNQILNRFKSNKTFISDINLLYTNLLRRKVS